MVQEKLRPEKLQVFWEIDWPSFGVGWQPEGSCILVSDL